MHEPLITTAELWPFAWAFVKGTCAAAILVSVVSAFAYKASS